MGRKAPFTSSIGDKSAVNGLLIAINLAKLSKSRKKGFKAIERNHIFINIRGRMFLEEMRSHDSRVILIGAWLSRVGSATNAPAHHAMDDDEENSSLLLSGQAFLAKIIKFIRIFLNLPLYFNNFPYKIIP